MSNDGHREQGRGVWRGMSLVGVLLGGLVVSNAASAVETITRTSSFDYDPVSGLLKKEVVEPGSADLCVVTEYGFDPYGRKTSIKTRNCNGSAGSTPGAVVEAVVPSAAAAFPERAASSVYDTVDPRFVKTTTNALKQQETRVYDRQLGVVTSSTGPNQLTTNWTYDGFGRKVRERRADGNGTTWAYQYCTGINGGTLQCPAVGGAAGAYAVTATPIHFSSDTAWAANGPYVRTYYDSLGRATRVETQGSDINGASQLVLQDTEYEANGNVYRQSRPFFDGQTKYWTVFQRDQLGRVTRVDVPDDAGTGIVSTTTAYDQLVTTVTDPLTHSTTEERDVRGQVVKITDAANNVLRRTYDAVGNLVQTADSKGNITSMVYDRRGRKAALYDADMGVWGYCYDALGQLKAQQSPRMRGSNALSACPASTGSGTAAQALPDWTTMAYDVLGRLTQRVEPDATSTWRYDTYANGQPCDHGTGKLCEVTAANDTSRKIVYDEFGRFKSSTTTIGVAYTAGVTYDVHGRVDTQSYPTGLVTRNVYTAGLGFLKQLIDNRNGQALWTADATNASGQLTQFTYGNTVTTSNQFFPGSGRLNITRAGSGNGVQNLVHTYDDAGALSTRVDMLTTVNSSYAYDELNRVLSETRSGGGLPSQTIAWTYDPIGNMLTRTESGSTNTYNYNPSGAGSNRPHAVANVSGFVNGLAVPSYQYDADGNLVSGAGRTMVWTSFDKVSSISRNSTQLTYLYGSEHERVKETYLLGGVSQRTTVYLNSPDGSGLFYEEESGVAGTKKKHYLSAGGMSIGMIVCTADPCTTVANTSIQYWHTDHLGSVSVVTNAVGTPIERMAYEPFGKRRNSNGQTDGSGTLTASSTDRGYTGHEHLDEVSLINMNGRIYDPALGRFMSADSSVQAPGSQQSYNRYAYTWNNPLNATDPSGYCTLDCFWQPNGRATQNLTKSAFNAIHHLPGQAAVDRYVMTHQWAYTVGSIAASFYGGPVGSAAWSSYYTYQGTGDMHAALNAGAVSLGTAIAFNMAGSAYPSGYENVLAHIAVGCLSSMAGGGQCRNGALAAGAGAAWSNYGFSVKDEGWGSIANVAVAATVGGTASVLGGGKFSNGAQTAAYGYLFNHWAHELELMMHGQEAHKLLQDWVEKKGYVVEAKCANFDACVDGRFDIADAKTLEVWEIKRFSWHGIAMGEKALDAYTQPETNLTRGGDIKGFAVNEKFTLSIGDVDYQYTNQGFGLITYERFEYTRPVTIYKFNIIPLPGGSPRDRDRYN